MSDGAPRTAIVTSRFPLVSETFILGEALELERAGVPVELFPLLRERAEVVHRGARELDRRAHHVSYSSRELWAAQWWWLRRRPRTYMEVWARAVGGNARSPGFLARALFVIPKAAAFARRMLRARVGHIHAHYATHPALAAWAASRLSGIPYSFTVHAHDLYVNRTMLGRKIAEARFVRTISEHNRELIAELYGEVAAAKTRVVHCGVNLERFRPAAAARNGHRFTIICVASLQEYKGHRYLLEALARVRARGIELRCLLVGDGELRGEIEAQRELLGLGDTVALCGPQSADAVRDLLAAADAAVLPSVVTASGKKEGIPVALMEAMAMEVPVVASDISGVSELVEDGESGLLVPQRDPEALADAIARLAEDPGLRRGLGRCGRERVVAEFNLSANVERLRDELAAASR